jgi:hypothetical protein
LKSAAPIVVPANNRTIAARGQTTPAVTRPMLRRIRDAGLWTRPALAAAEAR